LLALGLNQAVLRVDAVLVIGLLDTQLYFQEKNMQGNEKAEMRWRKGRKEERRSRDEKGEGWGKKEEGGRKSEKRTLATSTLLVPSSEARREVT